MYRLKNDGDWMPSSDGSAKNSSHTVWSPWETHTVVTTLQHACTPRSQHETLEHGMLTLADTRGERACLRGSISARRYGLCSPGIASVKETTLSHLRRLITTCCAQSKLYRCMHSATAKIIDAQDRISQKDEQLRERNVLTKITVAPCANAKRAVVSLDPHGDGPRFYIA